MRTFNLAQAQEEISGITQKKQRVQMGVQAPELLHTDWPDTFNDALNATEQSFGWNLALAVDGAPRGTFLAEREPVSDANEEVGNLVTELDVTKKQVMDVIDALRESFGDQKMKIGEPIIDDSKLCEAHRDFIALQGAADHLVVTQQHVESVVYTVLVVGDNLTEQVVELNCGPHLKLLSREQAVLSALSNS